MLGENGLTVLYLGKEKNNKPMFIIFLAFVQIDDITRFPEFASLLSDMWSGKSDVVTPNKFKSAVAKSAPRFVGYRYVLISWV